MKEDMKQAIIKYLQSVVDFDPEINAQNGGECIYCGSERDRGKPHKPDCHYIEAKRRLKEFREDN